MAISAAEQKTLANLARAANRRLERASEGQRSYLEAQIAKYHTRIRQKTGARVFQQGKAKSNAEYRARMRELQTFMQAKTSTIEGWKKIKAKQVEAAGETIRAGGSNLTDEELAGILRELEKGHSSAEFYKALANVEISKREAEAEKERLIKRAEEAGVKLSDKQIDMLGWHATEEEITDAMNARRTAQQRTQLLLDLRAAGVSYASAGLPR